MRTPCPWGRRAVGGVGPPPFVSARWPGAARRPALPDRTTAATRRRRSPRDVHARVAQAPLDQGLPPGSDTERTQRLQLGQAGRPAHQLPLAQRAHEQDAEAELVGQRQDRALHLALHRVVGHLDGVDAAGGHQLGQLPEGRRRVVGGSDQANQPAVPGGLEHRQMRRPGHQVVDLHEVDPAAVPVHRAGQLRRALLFGRGPDLVGDDDLVAPAVQRAGEQPLGVAVHRGGVEPPDTRRDGGADELAVPARGRGGLQPLPGTEPDCRHADPPPAQAPVVHVRHPRLVRPTRPCFASTVSNRVTTLHSRPRDWAFVAGHEARRLCAAPRLYSV